VKGATKLDRRRLLRFAHESILHETLNERVDLDMLDEEVPILPPVTYKAVAGMANILESLHDTFSNDARITRQIADAIGVEANPLPLNPKSRLSEINECETLRVEAESWYSFGKCLLNAFSKLYLRIDVGSLSNPDYIVSTSVKIFPSTKPKHYQLSFNPATSATSPSSPLSTELPPQEPHDEPSPSETKSIKRHRNSISETEDHTKRRLSKRVKAQEDTAAEASNIRGEEFVKALNAVLWPHVFGEYSSLDFFARDPADGTLDLWKTFLAEWSTERAVPFETNYKDKYPFDEGGAHIDQPPMSRIRYFSRGPCH
jgi:hypothetical protein